MQFPIFEHKMFLIQEKYSRMEILIFTVISGSARLCHPSCLHPRECTVNDYITRGAESCFECSDKLPLCTHPQGRYFYVILQASVSEVLTIPIDRKFIL